MWEYTRSLLSSELYHYGVQGMKWGVRNAYEPSPRKSGSGDATVYGSVKSKSISVAMKILNMLSPIPISALVSVGTKMYSKVKSGEEASKELLEKKVELSKKTKEFTAEKDAKAVNPGFTGLGGGNSNNCSNCTMSYELRRRGYDVTAKPLYGGRKQDDISRMFGKPKEYHVSVPPLSNPRDQAFGNLTGKRGKEGYKSLMSDLGKQPEGARGAIKIAFNSGMGHIFNWEKTGGKARLVETQNYGSNPDRYFKDVNPDSIVYFRTDNAKINMKLVHESVKNRR